MSEQQPVITQPGSILAVPGESGPVTIKFMTKEDAQFAVEMRVQGFYSKVETAVGRNNVEKATEVMTRDLLASPQWVYERTLIAFYNGEQAGICTLKFPGDKTLSESDKDFSDSESPSVGCCFSCRLGCFISMMNEDNVPPNTVFLDRICVDSKFRGQGIGKVLLDRADYEARKINAELIYLYVTQENRARNLYARHGYEIVDSPDGICFTYCVLGVRRFYKMSKPLR